jgi:hypothetical protein
VDAISKPDLDALLAAYEAHVIGSGAAPLTIQTRIEHARRIRAWTHGEYTVDGRAFAEAAEPQVDLDVALEEFRVAIRGSSLAAATFDTYSYHSGTFVDWVRAQRGEPRRGTAEYWVETTDRPDIGVDLNAPQSGSDGRPHAAYALITQVMNGDVVFHYATRGRAMVGWSRAIGTAYPDLVTWGTHAGTSDERRKPYERPGWRVGLEGPYPLRPSLSLSAIREREAEVRALRAALASNSKGALYFPFELSTKRPLRPTQFYLTRLPAELVDLFPQLRDAAAQASRRTTGDVAPPMPPDTAPFGDGYREAVVVPGVRPEPFSRDPDTMDRGRRGHTDTQNELADAVVAAGYTARSPKAHEPQYDILWETESEVFVAEVKSITSRNEERQLRLALGQVLRYRQVLQRSTQKPVVAVIASERRPPSDWIDLCHAFGVRFMWRGAFGDVA